MTTTVPQSRPAARVPAFTSTGGDLARIVVEDADDASRLATERLLRRAGHDVRTCGGPDALSRRRCPLEEGGDCPAVGDADVIVSRLTDDDRRQREVIARILEERPDTPVVVVAAPLTAYRHRDRLASCRVVPPRAPALLAAAVADALEGP